MIEACSSHRPLLSDWLLGIALLVGAGLWMHGAFPLTTGDLFHTQFAAYEWHIGTPERIYTTYEPIAQARWLSEWQRVATHLNADSLPWAHFYPPFLSAALAPVADVPAARWRNVMFAINLLLMFGMAYQIVRLCDRKVSVRPFLWALVLVLATNAVATTVNYGQVSLLAAVAIWAGLLLIRRKRDGFGGMLIGLAATVKLTPLVYVVYPVLHRRWKAAISGGSVFAVVILLSWWALGSDIYRMWWDATRYIGNFVWTCGLDQSISAWFARGVLGYGLHAAGFQATALIAAVRWIGDAVFMAGSFLLLWRRRLRLSDEDYPAAVGLLICGVMLSLPFVWNYYLVLPLPVLGWAIFESWRTSGSRFWNIWLGITAFFFCMRLYRLYGDTAIGQFFSGSHTLGLLMLWGWLIHRVAMTADRSRAVVTTI